MALAAFAAAAVLTSLGFVNLAEAAPNRRFPKGAGGRSSAAFVRTAASASGNLGSGVEDRRAPLISVASVVNGDAGQNDEGKGDNGSEPDLFDYFDPLLSPHAYPEGISPDSSPGKSGGGVTRERPPPKSSSGSGRSGGFITVPDDVDEDSPPSVNGREGGNDGERKDLFEYFDPLLSPHAYPDGIDAAKKIETGAATSSSGSGVQKNYDKDEDWSPLRMRSSGGDSFFGEPGRSSSGGGNWGKKAPRREDREGNNKRVYKRPHGLDDDEVVSPEAASSSGDAENEGGGEKPDLFDVFDPRISPHAYTQGIPDAVTYAEEASVSYSAFRAPDPFSASHQPKGSRQQIVGVLLIDHGSRKGISNARLQTLARTYNDRSPSSLVVRAAHMEIARPSILEGLRDLVETEQCGRVVCVPYFLSVGKHSTVDVPRLINEATEILGTGENGGVNGSGDVEVITTFPVGSNIDVMLGAIDGLVQGALGESDDELSSGRVAAPDKGQAELGGLFGDIKRMMDEEP